MLKPIVFVLSLSALAGADPAPTKITLSDAKPLIRALKLANVKSTKAKTKTTWAVKLVSCTSTKPEDPLVLEETECQADAQKLTGAAAVVLEEGMHAAKIPAPYMMGKSQIRASALTCTWDPEARGEDGPFVCTYTPMGR